MDIGLSQNQRGLSGDWKFNGIVYLSVQNVNAHPIITGVLLYDKQ